MSTAAHEASVTPEVSVVIVNYNGLPWLLECLAAVFGQKDVSGLEVVMVDNASTDGSLEAVEARYPGVRTVRAGRNLGFAAGLNLGVAQSRGAYIASLNPDAVADERWLAHLLAAIRAEPKIGMCASLMMRMDDPGRVDSAGVAIDVLGIAWDRLAGQPVEAASACREVFGACAGAALYRRELWDQLGGMDESYFMYLEDVDLAWRAQAAGWRCLFVPQARARHVHSAAAVEGSAFKNALKGGNKWRLLVLNYPLGPLLRWLPLIVAYDVGAVLLNVKSGNVASLRGRLRVLAQLPSLLAGRRGRARADSWGRVRRLMAGPQAPWLVLRRFARIGEGEAGNQ